MIDSALAHKGKYYGVRIGRQQGVYETWAEAHAQVVGFPGAAYQGFPTFHEAHAFVHPPQEVEVRYPDGRLVRRPADDALIDRLVLVGLGPDGDPAAIAAEFDRVVTGSVPALRAGALALFGRLCPGALPQAIDRALVAGRITARQAGRLRKAVATTEPA